MCSKKYGVLGELAFIWNALNGTKFIKTSCSVFCFHSKDAYDHWNYSISSSDYHRIPPFYYSVQNVKCERNMKICQFSLLSILVFMSMHLECSITTLLLESCIQYPFGILWWNIRKFRGKTIKEWHKTILGHICNSVIDWELFLVMVQYTFYSYDLAINRVNVMIWMSPIIFYDWWSQQ